MKYEFNAMLLAYFRLSNHSWLTGFIHKTHYASFTLQVHIRCATKAGCTHAYIRLCVALRFTGMPMHKHKYTSAQILTDWYLRVRVCLGNTPVSRLQFTIPTKNQRERTNVWSFSEWRVETSMVKRTCVRTQRAQHKPKLARSRRAHAPLYVFVNTYTHTAWIMN